MKDNHLLRDTTITDESDDTRTHKIFRAIDEVCYAWKTNLARCQCC